jgi:membrane-bound lytic murein transglycosylase D
MRQEFKLAHHLEQPEVQDELKWLLSHPKYLKQLTQSKPYIYHILSEVQKQHLPGELALIPMLESAYNPFAYSHAGAAGLWQLMPKTGKNLGVKGSWWVDDRRSITSSTKAALRYFSHLGRFFHGDWLLAIAAYDCGEGTVQRKMKNQPSYLRSFWHLPLPKETKHYVPRLLALSEIVAHPNRYHLNLPYFEHQPYFQEVELPGQIDLSQAAILAGISFKDLIRLNPGFNHWTTSPNNGVKLLIPHQRVQNFHANLNQAQHRIQSSLQTYQVKPGDTLSQIAWSFHTNPQFVIKLNHLKSHQLKPGQILHLPGHQRANLISHAKPIPKPQIPIAPRQYKILHIVQREEDLFKLAQQYKVSPSQIINWNHLKHAEITSGQKLLIWRTTNGSPFYVIKPGDTLRQIAMNNQLSLDLLLRLNPNLKARALKPGQTIKLLQ